MAKAKLECFAGKFIHPMWFRKALVCIGGFGNPKCKHLQKCIEQLSNVGVPKEDIERLVKKLVTNNKN